MHGRLAEALEGEPGLASTAPAAELAHHWGLAGEPDKALLWSVTAAEEADAAHALDAALLHLDRAVELWDVVPDAARLIGRERWQVLSWQGSMANLAGQNDKAIVLMERAVEEHRGDPDGTPAELGALYSRLTICLGTVVPHAEETLQASRRALELVPVSPASAVRAEALASAAHLHLRIDVHVARDLAREAAEVAGTVTARPLEARARTLLGMSLASVGDLEAGLASIDEAHALGVRHELHEEIARSAMCFIRYAEPIDWKGQPAEFVVGIAGAGDDHLTLLSQLAGVFSDTDQVERLRAAGSVEEVLGILSDQG